MQSRTFFATIHGDLTWTFTSMKEDVGFTGDLSVEGVTFPGVDEGCNGTFPNLDLEGGRAE